MTGVKLTAAQRRCLELARTQGGRVSSRDSLDAGLGPATPGLLASKGLLVDLGFRDGAQRYELPQEGRTGDGPALG